MKSQVIRPGRDGGVVGQSLDQNYMAHGANQHSSHDSNTAGSCCSSFQRDFFLLLSIMAFNWQLFLIQHMFFFCIKKGGDIPSAQSAMLSKHRNVSVSHFEALVTP